ncbi:MAG: hypothetical protein HY716_09550 [Planctomycetes bacterium]|nr:hypothetical protein [Planctomycetota bacterium]
MLWHVLFGSIFGWWILFLLLGGTAAGIASLVRKWNRRRRFVAAQRARLSNPQDAEVRFGLATICAEGRKWKKALRFIEEAISIAREDPRYNHVPYRFFKLRGDALYGLKRWKAASEAYREALAVSSDAGYEGALLGVARSEYRAGRLSEALAYSRHAVEENESLLEAYFRWAQAAAAAGNPAEQREAGRRFRAVVSSLPRFVRQRRLWWRLAFSFFPVSRRIA